MKRCDLNLIRYFSLVISVLILLLGIIENLGTSNYYDPLFLRIVLSAFGISYFFASVKIKFVKKYAVFFFYIIDHLVFLWLIYLFTENSYPDRFTNSIYVATILNSFLFIKSRHLIYFNSILLIIWFTGLYLTFGVFDQIDNKTFLILIAASTTIGYFFISSRNQLQSALDALEDENRKRADIEQELKEKTQGLESILNANPDLIFIQNIDGVYLDYYKIQSRILSLKDI